MKYSYPRIVLAGSGGNCGKTIISLGLLSNWRYQGRKAVGFKKGPDYIDTAWLSKASGTKARNLDVYLMGEAAVYESYVHHAKNSDISLIEGNRGLFDGMDAEGTYSTAELAKLIDAPIILAMDATKVTRTLAAFVLGCEQLDPELQIAGVILNRVAGARHERVSRSAIKKATGIDVVGAIPKLSQRTLLPERHLGLIIPEECKEIDDVCEQLREVIEQYTDIVRIVEIANQSPKLDVKEPIKPDVHDSDEEIKIGYFQDSAFSFYYPENLEALEREGACLVAISPLHQKEIPEVDGLYIGGGFPEIHAEMIANNEALLSEIKLAADTGLPIYAECGGLIFLSRLLRWQGNTYQMADVFPFEIEMKKKPQGHGYCEFVVDKKNPFLPTETKIRGHEFHYSSILKGWEQVETAYNVLRRGGNLKEREGYIHKRVLASYFHLHYLSIPKWAEMFVNTVKKSRKDKIDEQVFAKREKFIYT